MTEGKRGPRRGQRPPQNPSNSQEHTQPQRIELSTFPITFLDAYLYEMHIVRHPEHMANTQMQGGSITAEMAQPTIDQNQMQVAVKITATVPSEEAPAWSIEATMNGVFVIADGTDEALVRQFAQYTALSLLWPYLRELFQSLSLRMRVPLVSLPTLDTRQQPAPEQPHEDPEE